MEHSEYRKGHLEESSLSEDPITKLRNWLNDARVAGIDEPTAMCLATATLDAQPSARFLLLRGIDARGLVFYTHYSSRKGEEISDNPRVSAAFWWSALERQVRVEGYVEKVSADESDAYFADRPLESRYASAASPQSREVESREALERYVAELQAEFPEGPDRPESWGGYRIVPDRLEFWQGRPARLHDRLLYERTPEGWSRVRLAP